MSYQDTIDYLFGLQKHGIKLGLSNSSLLMGLMGNPERRFRSVHVAGTNGKGSTCAFLAAVLRAAGYRTGLYTSPHLVSFTERIRINGAAISESRVVDLAERIRASYSGLSGPDGSESLSPTFFEVTTAMACAYFAEESADIAVIETGMGGRLDSTNVVTPLVSIITNIDLEHTEFLGSTIEQIAAEKAGIVKQGIPVVTGATQSEALKAIEHEAARRTAPLYRMPLDFGAGRVLSGMPQTFDYRGISERMEGLRISLQGRHQVKNACLALAAIECLRKAGLDLPDRAIREGLEGAAWEGRLERVARDPDIFLDGAHNPASAAVLADALGELRSGYRRLVLVLGILKDKDHRGILSSLLPLADAAVATRPAYGRAMDAAALAAEIGPLPGGLKIAGSVEEAIALARGMAEPGDLIVVTGSLYTVGDARAVLRAVPPGDLQGLKG